MRLLLVDATQNVGCRAPFAPLPFEQETRSAISSFGGRHAKKFRQRLEHYDATNTNAGIANAGRLWLPALMRRVRGPARVRQLRATARSIAPVRNHGSYPDR